MEYVGGPDLRSPVDFEDPLPIIQQVIDGIEAAHEKNIVHRDLKPAGHMRGRDVPWEISWRHLASMTWEFIALADQRKI